MNLLTILLYITMQANLHYLVRQPEIKSAHPPLLILLHGVGSNEQDLFSLANHLPDKYLIISARSPITQAPGHYAWYQVNFATGKPVFDLQQEESSRKMIIDFIAQLKKEYAFDEHQVYLCGFSQGAIMSYSVALTRPDLVHGIAIMSGRLLEEIKPFVAEKQQLQGLKVFISHGTYDNTLGVQYAQQGEAYLKSLGLVPQMKMYADGHTINKDMLNDLVSWLNEQ